MNNTLFSYILVCIAQPLYVLGFVYANQNGFHVVQTNLVRGLSALIINFCILKYQGMQMDFKSIFNLKVLLTRNGLVSLHSLAFSLCQFYLPLSMAHTINCTGPVFILAEDYLMNGTRINMKQFTGILFALCGVILTINGKVFLQLFFQSKYQIQTQQSVTSFQNYYSTDEFVRMQISSGMVLILIAWAYGQISLKKCINVHSVQVNFHFGIVLTLISAFLYPIFVTNPVPMTKIYLALLICGAPIALSNLLYVHAMRINSNTGLLNLLMFISVVVGYGLSIFRYGQSVNILCLIGSLMILGGLMKTFLHKQQQKNASTISTMTTIATCQKLSQQTYSLQ